MSSAPKMLTIQGTRQSHLPGGSERDKGCGLDRVFGETFTVKRKAAGFLTSSNGAGEVARRKAVE
jgi:hypothetical protein